MLSRSVDMNRDEFLEAVFDRVHLLQQAEQELSKDQYSNCLNTPWNKCPMITMELIVKQNERSE